MRESVFTSEIVKSLQEQGAFAYKIPDVPVSMVSGLRFLGEKPCDIVGCYESKFFGIECKQIKRFQSFGMSQMRDSQVRNLDTIAKAGGAAYVFLNIRVTPDKEKDVKRENRLLIFNWERWRGTWDKGSTMKQILYTMHHFEGKKGRFDLFLFLKNLKIASI